MTSSDFSLLGVDPGLENLILTFVFSGDGGLRNILNLRLVCSTTKDWVDHLPKKLADVVFSEAQVTIGTQMSSLSLFLSNPPLFGVTALSLIGGNCEHHKKDPKAAVATCATFCGFWNKKLETIEFQREYYGTYFFNYLLLELLEMPNLRTLKFFGDFKIPEASALPSCFHKVREIHAHSILFNTAIRSEFYSQLKNNENLEVLFVNLNDEEDMVGATKLIDHKKENSRLQLTFTFRSFLEIPLFAFSWEPFPKFVLSIVASKSKIRLQVRDLDDFKKRAKNWLRHQPHSVCLELFKKVELINRS